MFNLVDYRRSLKANDGDFPIFWHTDARVPTPGAGGPGGCPSALGHGGQAAAGPLRHMELDGLLGPAIRGVRPARDILATASERARALEHAIFSRGVAIGITAAWVWDGMEDPNPLQVAALPGHRQGGLKRTSANPDDIHYFRSVAVTNPERTALDLARHAPLNLAATHLVKMSSLGLISIAGVHASIRPPLGWGYARAREILGLLSEHYD